MATSPVGNASDPFPKLTEFNSNVIPTVALSPLSSPMSESDDSVVDIPVIQEFGTAALKMPKSREILKGQSVQKGIDIKKVLVEWKPPQQTKTGKAFVQWDGKREGILGDEDLENLEADYLNVAKLAATNVVQEK